MTHKSYSTGDVAFFGFGVSNASGNGINGSAATFNVMDMNAAAGAAPIASGSAYLFTNAGVHPGQWRIRTTTGPSYSANTEYGVYLKVNASGVTPTAFVGTFDLGRNQAQAARAVSTLPSSAAMSAMIGPAVWNESGTEPTVPIAWGSANRGQIQDWLGARHTNRHHQSSTELSIYSSAGAVIASASVALTSTSANQDQFLG